MVSQQLVRFPCSCRRRWAHSSTLPSWTNLKTRNSDCSQEYCNRRTRDERKTRTKGRSTQIRRLKGVNTGKWNSYLRLTQSHCLSSIKIMLATEILHRQEPWPTISFHTTGLIATMPTESPTGNSWASHSPFAIQRNQSRCAQKAFQVSNSYRWTFLILSLNVLLTNTQRWVSKAMHPRALPLYLFLQGANLQQVVRRSMELDMVSKRYSDNLCEFSGLVV